MWFTWKCRNAGKFNVAFELDRAQIYTSLGIEQNQTGISARSCGCALMRVSSGLLSKSRIDCHGILTKIHASPRREAWKFRWRSLLQCRWSFYIFRKISSWRTWTEYNQTVINLFFSLFCFNNERNEAGSIIRHNVFVELCRANGTLWRSIVLRSLKLIIERDIYFDDFERELFTVAFLTNDRTTSRFRWCHLITQAISRCANVRAYNYLRWSLRAFETLRRIDGAKRTSSVDESAAAFCTFLLPFSPAG